MEQCSGGGVFHFVGEAPHGMGRVAPRAKKDV